MRWSVLLLACVMAGPLIAQERAEPLVTVTLEEDETVPGQPLSLRVTVLVPTWMTKPVEFPSLEAPDLMVRLPERSTTPVSERIEGETWSGVSRNYQITPMVPAVFDVPPSDLVVTWSDPETNETRSDTVRMDGATLKGVLPEGAEGLDPFIAAQDITLSQETTGANAPLKPGDSVTRVVTATITGASPMFLPTLLGAGAVTGIAQYPAEPVLAEKTQRGEISGTRTERMTYLAQSGGQGAAEPITFDWFNLKTGKIETASLDGFDLSVDAPIARDEPAFSTRMLMLGALALGGVVLIIVLVGRPVWSRWSRRLQQRQAAYMVSEQYARDRLADAVKRRDLSGCLSALDLWAARSTVNDPRTDGAVQSALTLLGSTRYGNGQASEKEGWRQLDAALRSSANDRQTPLHFSALPPLNPRG